MNAVKVTSVGDLVRDTIQMHIEKESQRIADEYKEKALKDLEVAIRKAVVETSVTLSRMINVKDCGEQITIQIRDERKSS